MPERPKRTTSPYIRVRLSEIHGQGVFAKMRVVRGTRVLEYVGPKITKAEGQRRAEKQMDRSELDPNRGAVYIFELNKRQDIDGSVWYNTAKYINHSCDPNCRTDIIRGRIWIIAKRAIEPGEEITYNYGYPFDNYDEHECRCGTELCVGYILARDHWRKLKNIKVGVGVPS